MNKEERIQYVLDSIKDNVAVNIALSLVEECDELQQENKKYKEVIEKAIEYIQKMFETGFYNDDYYLGKLKKILSYKEVE